MRVCFTVWQEPQGKARPKFAKRGRYVTVRTPEKTRAYEKSIQEAYLQQCGNQTCLEGGSVEMKVTAYFKIPKSASKNKRQAMLLGEIRPTKKPDADNILKAVADALNGVAYKDDACVVKMDVEKFYSDVGRIDVVVESF